MTGEITGFRYTSAIASYVNVEYTNSKSEKSTFRTFKDSTRLKIFKLIDKYATPDNPNITGKEICEIRKDISMFTKPLSGGNASVDYYKGIDFLLNTYTLEESDAGKEITPKEIAYMYEAMQSWDD